MAFPQNKQFQWQFKYIGKGEKFHFHTALFLRCGTVQADVLVLMIML